MSYKPGDKFIIELSAQIGDLYRVKGFRALVFDDNGLKKLQAVKHPGEKALKIAQYFRCMHCERRNNFEECYNTCRYFLSGYEAVKEILEGKK